MKAVIISSALNARVESLSEAFAESGFLIEAMWTGVGELSELPEDATGIVILETSRMKLLDVLMEVRRLTRHHSLPIVIVPEDFSQSLKAKCLSVCAAQLCSPDESDERIVAEVKAATEMDGGEADRIRRELLHPFIAAMMEATQISASVDCEVDEILRKDDFRMQGDISGLITLVGTTERLLVLTCPEQTATRITQKVLDGVVITPDTAMIADCIGEIVNIVAGQVKGRFVHTEYEFDITTPTVISGPNHEIHHRPDLPCYVMTFSSPVGRFSLQLCVRNREMPL